MTKGSKMKDETVTGAKAAKPKQASAAKMRPRHHRIVLAFKLGVLLPSLLAAVYLFAFAKDQYVSHMGIVVRKQEASTAVDLLGGITQLSGSASSDTDILFEFLQSQRLVRTIDKKTDLRTIYSAPSDPVFGLASDASIEDLVSFWGRVVNVYYSNSTRLIEIHVKAFNAEDALKINQLIYEESALMINNLSIAARNDATRHAREELQQAKDRLATTRNAVQKFRLSTQIVDPEAELLGRMGVVNSLQSQLATAQVELDLLLQSAGSSDPRVTQMKNRVEAIKQRLTSERKRFSVEEGNAAGAYATLVGEYERLSVDRKFAETAYVTALSALDVAMAEAARNSRYLVSYIEPTLAETPEHPQRLTILLTLVGFLFTAWAIGVMVYYSIRDRR